jgi:hypothetical protein
MVDIESVISSFWYTIEWFDFLENVVSNIEADRRFDINISIQLHSRPKVGLRDVSQVYSYLRLKRGS